MDNVDQSLLIGHVVDGEITTGFDAKRIRQRQIEGDTDA